MTTRPRLFAALLPALLAAALLAAALPAAALDAAETERVFTARFAKLSKAFAEARPALAKAERSEGDEGLARAARAAADGDYRRAAAKLDAVEALLAASPRGETTKGASRRGAKGAPAPEEAALGEDDGEAGPRRSALPPHEFTLEEAFRPKEAPGSPASGGSGDSAPPPSQAPDLKKFDPANLDKADQRNLRILNDVLPQVESVFKRHPNPETAEAMKQTRRFIYYLKKRACGYPAEPETDGELDLFIKSRIKKVRVIEK